VRTIEDGIRYLARRGAGRCLECGAGINKERFGVCHFCRKHRHLEPNLGAKPNLDFEKDYEKPIRVVLAALRILA